MGLLFIKTVPPPPCAPGKAAFSELARASSFSAPQPAAQPTGGQCRWWWRPSANQGATKNGDPSWMSSETCFLDTWDKGGPHGAYPLPLSEKGVSLLLLQTPLISGIPHLPVWLPPQVASMPPQEEAPTSKVLLLLLHGRARPGGRNYLFFFLLFFFACFLASTSCSLKLHFSAGAFFLLSSGHGLALLLQAPLCEHGLALSLQAPYCEPCLAAALQFVLRHHVLQLHEVVFFQIFPCVEQSKAMTAIDVQVQIWIMLKMMTLALA